MISAFGIQHTVSKGLPSAAKLVPLNLKPKTVLEAKKLANARGKEASWHIAQSRTRGSGWTTSRYRGSEAVQGGRNALASVPGARAPRTYKRRSAA